MSMRSPSKKRTTAKERKLVARIEELEEKLATSIPKAEFDCVKLNLQLEIDDLQRRLSDSVPRADLDYVKNELQRICDLEGKLGSGDSDRSEETEELRTRISELEKLLRATPGTGLELDSRVSDDEIEAPELSESVPGEPVEMEAESRFTELQQALSESKRETDALREKISELESRREDHATEGSEESESTESYIQSQTTE